MSLDIQPVRTAKDLDAFIRLPWALYGGNRNWIPPLISSERRQLDPARNPFYRHAEARHFLARRNGRLVGRVSAITNSRHAEFHGENIGFFGYFESEDDPDTARALLAAAEGWIRAQGLDRIRGPVNPSINDPCGLLIEGFKWPPFVLMTVNPEYYPRLVEAAGYAKAKDLYAYILLDTDVVRDKVARVAAQVSERSRVTLRTLDLSRFEDELGLIMEIYNDAWSKNWGFVPMTQAEIRFAAEDLRPVVLPELVYFAYLDGAPVGFSLALPDINHALRRANGRLFPFGWFYFLKPILRKIPAFRILALGVKRAHQHSGIGALFYDMYMKANQKLGYKAAELSWTLEDNEPMNRPIRQMGGKPYKIYRIYEKAINQKPGVRSQEPE
ncbi:MAG: N-acetyltransferase [Planctomycetes bacterium]|nr:N-acetyltransferase [Planctomycetota bacterium]